MAAAQDRAPGTQLAIGILLLWFSGVCFYVAFLGGKSPALQVKDAKGNPVGPTDISSLVSRMAENVQSLESPNPVNQTTV